MVGTWGLQPQPDLVEPQKEVSAVPPIKAGGDLSDIHPMRRGGVKSFVDDLVLGRGVVSSRAATSLRTVETQPWTRRFVRTRRTTSPTWWWWSSASAASCSATNHTEDRAGSTPAPSKNKQAIRQSASWNG